MKQAAELIRALKDMMATDPMIMPAIVKSVDQANSTCVVEIDELEIGEVRIQSIVDENTKGIKVFPTVGSFVLVQRINDEEYFIALFSEVNLVRIEVDTTKFEVNQGVFIGRGEDSLKDILTLIIQSVQQIVVLYGNNPDFVKLEQAISKINTVLK